MGEALLFCKRSIDSQSVKTSNQPYRKGFDGNKKINGLKRHIMVDIIGLVHELLLSEANKHDRPEAKILVSSIQRACFRVEKLIADKGYDSEEFIR